MGLLLIAPVLGARVRWGGLPPGFVFPAERGLPKAPFTPGVFALLCLFPVLLTALVVAPRLFGFRAAAQELGSAARARLPPWFWGGASVMLACLYAMWAQPASLGSLVRYAFSPQWWGFILALDGVVYARTGGRSLLATRPRTMLALAVTSCFAWYPYEYLNAFLLEQWYYPVRGAWPHAGYVLAYSVAYTTISPAVIEWYLLFRSFPSLARRFTDGPRVASRSWLPGASVVAGLLLTFSAAIWQNQLFFAIWVGPDLVVAGALALAGVWTPFTPTARGDWSRVVLPAVACMANGVIWEMWNHFSLPSNPHYWAYDVPYADVARVFGMPLIGFFGYAPFGVSVWLTWIFFATVLGVDPAVEPGVPAPGT